MGIVQFTVKRGDQEIVASDVKTLRRWVSEGQINPSDYVHNSILNKWMYVRELAEVEDLIRKQESTAQAAQYNRLSFIFAGLGVLMLFVFPLAGAVLLIIGVILSAMYYVKKA